jgi:hypothetical protein
MKIPGFTAENSLQHEPSERHLINRTTAAVQGGQRVLPQLLNQFSWRDFWCRFYPNSAECTGRWGTN